MQAGIRQNLKHMQNLITRKQPQLDLQVATNRAYLQPLYWRFLTVVMSDWYLWHCVCVYALCRSLLAKYASKVSLGYFLNSRPQWMKGNTSESSGGIPYQQPEPTFQLWKWTYYVYKYGGFQCSFHVSILYIILLRPAQPGLHIPLGAQGAVILAGERKFTV